MKEILFRNTAEKKGRHLLITPENSDLEIMSIGRIILDSQLKQIQFNSGENEISLICLHGVGKIKVNNSEFSIELYDAVYVPRESNITISTETYLDLVESSAPVSEKYIEVCVKYSDVKNDDKLHMSLGGATDHRELYTLVGDNVKGGRLFNGFTIINSGNWASWPPHEHKDTREEVYLYFDIPSPAFALQLLYDKEGNIDKVFRMFEDDAIVVTKGFHPNVAIPGFRANFVWMLCAKREIEDRKWTGSNIHSELKIDQ
jgi:5-deoxy-glucuronate isomerase